MMNPRLDVLVIGGGAQGLLTLRYLTSRGYRCLLVNRRALGEGQTLANHGWLHTGYVFPRTELATPLYRLAKEKWQLFLEAHPEVVRAHSMVYVAAPTSQFESTYLPTWGTVGMPHQIHAPSALPAWMRGGSLDSTGMRVARVGDRILNKNALVRALAVGVEDLVLFGEVKRLMTAPDGRIVSVELAGAGATGAIILQPNYVVLCAGVGTLELLQRIEVMDRHVELAEEIRKIGIRRAIHMICLRGRDDILPDISIFEAIPGGFHMVASHYDAACRMVLWYVTPMDSDAAAYLSTRDPLLRDDEAPVQAKFVRQAVEGLMAKYPSLAAVANKLEWGVYAEHKLDHGSAHPLSPYAEPLRFAPNVCVCNPSLLSYHFTVAEAAVRHVEDYIGHPDGERAVRPSGIRAPGIGVSNQDRPTMNWLSWEHFQRRYEL